MLFSRLAYIALAALVPFGISLSTSPDTGAESDLYLSVLTSHQTPPNSIHARTPPSLTNTTDPAWVPAPQNWIFGSWYFSHSSSPAYQSWRNMQWTLSRRKPNTRDYSLHDLATYQQLNSTTVYMLYVVDFPVPALRDVYNSVPPAPASDYNNTWALVSWGYDTVGVPYAMFYETPAVGQTDGALDIVSRSDRGVHSATLRMLNHTVHALGNQDLIALMGETRPLRHDADGLGVVDPICNATCRTNAYSGYF